MPSNPSSLAIPEVTHRASYVGTRMDELRHTIEHAAHLLPSQGPITVFVHHNTLHALEHLPFDDALRSGSKIFRAEPYLAEDRYREMLTLERIRMSDLTAVLEEDLDDRADHLIGFMGTRYSLRLAMLQYPLRTAPTAELRWLVAETDALRRFRSETTPAVRRRVIDETQHWVLRDMRNGRHTSNTVRTHRVDKAIQELIDRFGASSIETWSESTWESFCLHLLWRICLHGVHGIPPHAHSARATDRHRDLLLEATGIDVDRFVHEPLIRFCAAFLDQGFADWPLPKRDRGFFEAFCALHSVGLPFAKGYLKGLNSEIARLKKLDRTPLESIDESLKILGVTESQRPNYIQATLLALPGWAGMIQQMEVRSDRVAYPVATGTLVEFVAVRLILERIVLRNVAEQIVGFRGELHELSRVLHKRNTWQEGPGIEQRAFQVLQLAQVLGWLPKDLYRLTKREWTSLLEEIEDFTSLERRRIYQLAFERRYRVQTLDAIANHSQWLATHDPAKTQTQTQTERHKPKFQFITCIDDREESLRRHLEEIQPQVETFSAPGFFAVPMYYRGASDAHFVPLCPIVMRPQHWVVEDVSLTFEEEHRRRTNTRRILGTAAHRVHVGSRTFFGGLLTAFVGPLASIPLVMRVLFPRLTAKIRQDIGRLVQPPPVTRLTLARKEPDPAPSDGHLGFTTDEKAAMVERLLRDTGLTSNFSRLIIVVGHGSSSLNNPHESAYNCGACGGSRGGPNARSFAQIANEPFTRARLAENGLKLPEDTVFVGAFHNTCDESIVYFDLHNLPWSHKSDFDEARKALDQARERNAQERCRRFISAELSLSPEAALRHVEARAEDLSQTRPEYNHATNAVCIVARRSRTRGLFLDRRSFLNSYDPTQDDAEFSILTRILQAAVPVCGGINLEYYFSTVDPVRFGCGTKLPHNITSLVGVMDGAASDLRTGLSTQMTEIHDPVRLLLVIETTPEAMLSIMDRNEGIGRMCRNGWVQLAVLDPHSSQIRVFRQGRFYVYRPESPTLPEVTCSSDWFRGWRENLGYARICAKDSA